MLLARSGRAFMSVMASAEKPVAKALQDVGARINNASAKASRPPPRLVAVSKFQAAESIQEAYDAGQRIFGENYVQEMVEKAPKLPQDIQWHFIGHLQSNKIKAIIEGVPNLAMIETVDTVKLADKLNKAVQAAQRPPLRIFMQVNTSGEEAKSGVDPPGCAPLAAHIAKQCPHLQLAGLMTIGMLDYTSTPENFKCLARCRDDVAKELSMQPQDLELSMGMSGDFELAIEMGSTNVRIGSTIFGARKDPRLQAQSQQQSS
mmetsp:Transcript_32171/g.83810  ORF Transcript_32171/g.83810 Transcript_32171/m.83810 type:complete len:261 (-) Transcript_32171:307-1089(-)